LSAGELVEVIERLRSADGADGLEESSSVPESHGSEAEFRNQETCIAERCVFHVVFLSNDSEVSLPEGNA
jgi:hypothetical protein